MYKRKSILMDKSKAFALRIIKMYRYLCEEKKEFVLSKQVLRSGTSIGANIREGFQGQSDADFIAKLSISQKEVSETMYLLELLHESGYMEDKLFESIYADGEEIMKLLTSSLKKKKATQNLTLNT